MSVPLATPVRPIMAPAPASHAPPAPATVHSRYDGGNRSWLLALGIIGATVAGSSLYIYLRNKRRQRRAQPQSQLAARTLKIGTRCSALAMWQAEHVRDALALTHQSSSLSLPVVGINTAGDIDQSTPLTNFTNKGIFTKELDTALYDRRIDLAVHCMKDLPTILPPGLSLAAVLERGDIEDAVIINTNRYDSSVTLDTLPANAVIGTSALRRRASLAKYYPSFQCHDVRGNVNTRLAKLDRGDFDALILAAIGLKRLGLENRIGQTLDKQRFGYAVGQGALAIITRDDDAITRSLVAPLNHRKTALECQAERGLLRKLEGGCKVPIAVRSSWLGSDLTLWASVLSLDGQRTVEFTGKTSLVGELTGAANEHSVESLAAWQLGELVGAQLMANGADKILAEIK